MITHLLFTSVAHPLSTIPLACTGQYLKHILSRCQGSKRPSLSNTLSNLALVVFLVGYSPNYCKLGHMMDQCLAILGHARSLVGKCFDFAPLHTIVVRCKIGSCRCFVFFDSILFLIIF